MNLIKSFIFFACAMEAVPSGITPYLAAAQSELTIAARSANGSELRIPVSARADEQNPYLQNVTAVILDARVRRAIYRVQPACVRLDSASGVNLNPNGDILTAAHVA